MDWKQQSVLMLVYMILVLSITYKSVPLQEANEAEDVTIDQWYCVRIATKILIQDPHPITRPMYT